MKRLLSTILCFAWALWFGGLMALFLFVQTLFARSRPLAMETAPILFVTFERYELILGVIALLAAVGWRVLVKSRLLTLLLILILLAAVGAIVSSMAITAPMEELRAAGQSASPDFKRLHAYSMMVYTAQAALLAVAGLILPSALQTRTPTTAAPDSV